MKITPKLEDFEDGIVAGVQWPGIHKVAQAVQLIQGWIDAGLLFCPGATSKLDPVSDHLFRVQKPKVEAKPVEHSWPYRNGAEQRIQDNKTGQETACHSIGVTRLRWLAGYNGEPELSEAEYSEQLWPSGSASTQTASVPIGSEADGPHVPLPNARSLPFDSPGESVGSLATGDDSAASSEPTISDPESPAAASPADGGDVFKIKASDWVLSKWKEETSRIHADDIEDLVNSLEVEETPEIHALSGLLGLCTLNSHEEDCEFWQILTIVAALQLVPHGWIMPIGTPQEAFETLKELERASQPNNANFIASINDVFSKLFSEDHAMVTATAKSTAAKARARAKKPDKPQGKGSKGKPANPVKVAESLYRIDEQIIDVDLSTCTKSPYDSRIDGPEDSPELRLLGGSLKRGQINTLLLRPDHQHVAGWRRIRAARLVGLKTLQARIVHCDDLTASLLVLEENENRKPLTDRERCVAYNERLKDYVKAGKTQKQLAADLSIDHSTLSNLVRLKSLPSEVWDRYESDGLSIEQIRQIATHAMVDGFADAVLAFLEANQEQPVRPGAVVFGDALAAGFDAAYRPMAGSEFRPTPQQKKELGVIEVDHPKLGKIEVTTCVAEFDELNKAAVQKRKDKAKADNAVPAGATATAEPEKPKKPDAAALRAQKEMAANHRKQDIGESWCLALSLAIRDRFVKCRKGDVPQLIRVGFLIQQMMRDAQQMRLDVLLVDEAKFIELVQQSVLDFFDTSRPPSQFEADWSDLWLDDLVKLGKWLTVNATPFWRATMSLVEGLSDDEAMHLLRDEDSLGLEEGVLDGDRKELNQRLFAAWEPGGKGVGWFPPMFALSEAQ